MLCILELLHSNASCFCSSAWWTLERESMCVYSCIFKIYIKLSFHSSHSVIFHMCGYPNNSGPCKSFDYSWIIINMYCWYGKNKVSQSNTNPHCIWCMFISFYSIPFNNASHTLLVWLHDPLVGNYPVFNISTVLSYILIEPHATDKLEVKTVWKTISTFTSHLWDYVGRTLLNYCM